MLATRSLPPLFFRAHDKLLMYLSTRACFDQGIDELPHFFV